MARRCVVLGLLALSLAPSVWADGPYIDSALRFGVTPPPGWTIAKPVGVVVAMVAPEDMPARTGARGASGTAGFRANITVITQLSAGTTLARYAEESRKKSRAHKWFRLLRERPTRLGGLAAIERDAQIRMTGGFVSRTRQIMAIRGDRVFLVTLTAASTDYRRRSDEFDKVLAGFTWRK